jgi:hypothetical protein
MGSPDQSDRTQEQRMKTNHDLIGKTITGVIAVTPPGEEVREIWMLQFSDGSHVEFVSPAARRSLRRSAGRKKAAFPPRPDVLQLALNVA